MLPLGRSSDADAPFKIWSKTGTLGDSNETPFTVNRKSVVFYLSVGEPLILIEIVLTRATVRAMLMSAPPTTGSPG